jgi:hypothetical protein
MKRQTKNGEKKRIFLQTKIIRYSKKVVPFFIFICRLKKICLSLQKQLNIKVMLKFKEILNYYRERQRVVNVLNSCTSRNHIDIAINYLKAFKNKWSYFLDKDIIIQLRYNRFEQDFYTNVIIMETKMI